MKELDNKLEEYIEIDAKSQGAKFCDGRELLSQQGAIAFEHWFNVPAPLQIMKKTLQNKYNEL
jgi:shikimate 5-dehydrogenase